MMTPERDTAHMEGTQSTPIRRYAGIFMWLVFAVAILYLLSHVRHELALAIEVSRQFGAWHIVGALAACLLTLLLQARYHIRLLFRLSGRRAPANHVLAAYVQAQVVRYLPGKIWGIIFQSHRLSHHYNVSDIVLTNLWQAVMTQLLTAGIVATVFLSIMFSHWFLLGLVPTTLLIEILHRYPYAERWLLKALSFISPRLSTAPPPPPWRIEGTLLLVGEWVTYLLLFVVLLSPVASLIEALLAGTWYAGASLLAMAAVVVPAGLAVREAIFLAAPDLFGFSMPVLVATAAVVRLVQIASEVLLAMAASISARVYPDG